MAPPEADEELRTSSAEEQLRHLTGSLAHNLNNRLAVVIGTFEYLAQELGQSSPLTTRLQAGLKSAWQAAEMVRRMVTFAYRPSGLPDTLTVSLGEVAENAVRRVREQQHPGLTVEVVHTTARPARANPLLVQMALDSLIANAIEAMSNGGMLTLEVSDNGSDSVCLQVRDTGPGLSDQAAANLYEPFVSTRSAGHLGLGLVLSRDLARAMGGRLELTWASGQGTCAMLSFPVDSAGSVMRPTTSEEPPVPPSGTLWHVI